MSEVSHFELLLKPQAPSGPGSSGSQSVATVLQGYFLELTNLEDETYQFRVDLVIEPPGQNLANRNQRTLAGTALAFVDTSTQNNQQSSFSGSIGDAVFPLPNGLVDVQPGGTALIAVLPNAFQSNSPIPLGRGGNSPDYEVRGYVRLRLPPTASSVGSGRFRLPTAQSDKPVKVLATPQNRSTYLAFDPSSSMGPPVEITDQTQALLPLADGQARLEVEPESLFFTFGARAPEDALERAERVAQSLSDEARSDLILGQLAGLDPEGEGLKALNARLKEMGAGITLKKSK